MDRFGIFVDAGYLFAASGKLCCGTTIRSEIVLDVPAIANPLVERAAQDCGLQHLRTYWYDGAHNAQPTAEHLGIANLPTVKLRLGRLTRTGQKGVDSRIVRDLIILSQERALSFAYLLGGDEDLREGVSEAQERGVRVVLMAVEPLNEQNLSPTLAMEADSIIVLKKDFFEGNVNLKEQTTTSVASPADPLSLGAAFASYWAGKVSREQIDELRRNRPAIPRELDRGLLVYAVKTLGNNIEEDARRELRRGFWQAILGEPNIAGS